MVSLTTSPNDSPNKKAVVLQATLVVPVLNAQAWLPTLLPCLAQLVNRGDYQCLIIDSASTDATKVLCHAYPQLEFLSIARCEFDHGGTRNLALTYAKADIVVYLSQDALPTLESVQLLVSKLQSQPDLAAAYGRQLPHAKAQAFGAHLRAFNYPPHSYISSPATLKERGIKAAFLSNAFCAYNINALNAVGQFPDNTIIGEDFIVGAKFLAAGYSLAYVAKATAIHSHDYTPLQELKRYFDIGCMHRQEAWIFTRLARPEKAGRQYVISEWRWLINQGKVFKIPESIVRTLLKWLGYKLGKHSHYLPKSLNKALSMNKNWWNK